MAQHEVMKASSIRTPYPDTLQVRCPHREKESIIKISMMPVLVKEQNKPSCKLRLILCNVKIMLYCPMHLTLLYVDLNMHPACHKGM